MKKFDKEFDDLLREDDDSEVELFNYQKTCEVLNYLGFLAPSSSTQNQERVLLSDMWKIMQGEQTGGVTQEQLRKFLHAVLGFFSEFKYKIEIEDKLEEAKHDN